MLILNVTNSSVTTAARSTELNFFATYAYYKYALLKTHVQSLDLLYTWRLRTPANIRIYLIFLENSIIGLYFVADNVGLSSLKLLWRFRKTILLLQEWRFGCSRSSNVIDFGTNLSAYATSYIVRSCAISEILQAFCSFACRAGLLYIYIYIRPSWDSRLLWVWPLSR